MQAATLIPRDLARAGAQIVEALTRTPSVDDPAEEDAIAREQRLADGGSRGRRPGPGVLAAPAAARPARARHPGHRAGRGRPDHSLGTRRRAQAPRQRRVRGRPHPRPAPGPSTAGPDRRPPRPTPPPPRLARATSRTPTRPTSTGDTHDTRDLDLTTPLFDQPAPPDEPLSTTDRHRQLHCPSAGARPAGRAGSAPARCSPSPSRWPSCAPRWPATPVRAAGCWTPGSR